MDHIASLPTSPDGWLFVTPIAAWVAARAAAFTEAEYASPLAKRPYYLPRGPFHSG